MILEKDIKEKNKKIRELIKKEIKKTTPKISDQVLKWYQINP